MTKSIDTRLNFRTVTQLIELDEFDVTKVSILDIAEGLCKANRYSGQYEGDHMCSVAQHSVHVSMMIEQEMSDPRAGSFHTADYERKHIDCMAMMGLIHDGSEAYMGDMATPFKKKMPDFQIIEEQFQNAIYERYLGKVLTEEEENLLKLYDFRVFNMECRALMRPCVDDQNIIGTMFAGETFETTFGHRVAWWDIPLARTRFLERYVDLSNRLNILADAA